MFKCRIKELIEEGHDLRQTHGHCYGCDGFDDKCDEYGWQKEVKYAFGGNDENRDRDNGRER